MLCETRNRKKNILNNCHIVGDAKKEKTKKSDKMEKVVVSGKI